MFFQLYFLTDVAKLNPLMVGWVLGITRLWDAINDPLIGLISDRIRSRLGRRRVLLVYGSIPLGLFFALTWLVPPLSQLGLAIYYAVLIVAFDTAFTIVHVGYNAMTPLMTDDYDQRSRLNGYRMVYSLGGTLAAIFFATWLSELGMSETYRFAIAGITLGLLATIPPWIVFRVTDGVDVVADPDEDESNLCVSKKTGLWVALKTTLTNRAFVMLTCMYLASWTATCVIAAMLIYYANYYLKVPGQANYFVLVAQGSAILSVPLCVWMAQRWDKPKAFIIGIGSWLIVLGLFFSIPETAVSLAYICAFLCGPGIATAAVIPWSMLPDVVEEDQQRTGHRREGSYYAFASFFQKLGTGLALWGIGMTLGFSGYITPDSSTQFPVQPETTLTAIRFIIGPGTIALLLVALPFAWRYPITRESHARLVEKLNLGKE